MCVCVRVSFLSVSSALGLFGSLGRLPRFMVDPESFVTQRSVLARIKARRSTVFSHKRFGQVFGRLDFIGRLEGHVGVFLIGRNLDSLVVEHGIGRESQNETTADTHGRHEGISRRIAQPRLFKVVLVLFLW